MKEKEHLQRLESLDVLRGFDLFFLVAIESIVHPLQQAINTPWFDSIMWNFSHVEWEGFSPWDLVMPLFLFMSGVSIPFALSRYKKQSNKTKVYKRIGKRILLLWIFGMMCQGNLLGLNPDQIYLYSNTLQAIAIGYLISALLFLHVRIRNQVGAAIFLLLTYWGAMQFITIGDFGGGNYTANGNLSEWIDRTVLGRFRDGARIEDGNIVFAEYYRYTWILSSLNFGVTILTGLFAGHILKYNFTQKKKVAFLLSIGAAMIVFGWLWHFQMPVIKKLWTSSMVLVSSGYCFILMGLFYYWIDYKGHRKHITWLKVYGINSIVAYMIANIIRFNSIGESLFGGTKQYFGNFYPVLIALMNVIILYLILRILYKHNIFLKV